MKNFNLFRQTPNEFQTPTTRYLDGSRTIVDTTVSGRWKKALPLLFLLGLLGFNPQTAWADENYTFAKDRVIYVDMTAITASNFTAKIFVDFGNKYTATNLSGSYTFNGYSNGEFTNCNAPKIQLTFKETVNIGSDKIIFESSVGNWTSIKNQFPTSGQNLMTVGSDGKSITWSTYSPTPTCSNCKTITK